MIYIKTFENWYVGSHEIQRIPKKGDYVLLKYPEYVNIENVFNRPKDFFDTHIGEIIKKSRMTKFYLQNAAYPISTYTIRFDPLTGINGHNLLNKVSSSEIKVFSENKEDLESIIARNKFNI